MQWGVGVNHMVFNWALFNRLNENHLILNVLAFLKAIGDASTGLNYKVLETEMHLPQQMFYSLLKATLVT